MSPKVFAVCYAAHTDSCSFLLDAEGICRRIVLAPRGKRRSSSRTSSRCLGAQYVASLDGSAAGGLVEMPRVGAAMLFARVDERGRVVLVRTGVVRSFESLGGEDPFEAVDDTADVETSAPEVLTPRVLTRNEDHTDPDYFDARTQRTRGLRSEETTIARGDLHHGRREDFTTSEYEAVGQPAALARDHEITDEPEWLLEEDDARPSLADSDEDGFPVDDLEDDELATSPSIARSAALPHAPTLRTPHRDTTVEDEDYDDLPYTPVIAPATSGARPTPTGAHSALGRSGRGDPRVRSSGGHAAHAYAIPAARATEPIRTARSSDVQVSTRRRQGG